MSVDYSATLGYGLIVDPKDIPDPEDVGVWEILENVLAEYPLLTYETGGGGWSSTSEQYVIFLRHTTQSLNEVDGVIVLKRPKIDVEALNQLDAAYAAATGRYSITQPGWLIVGGFY